MRISQSSQQALNRADTNNNGVSAAELRTFVRQNDRNNDGQLSAQEGAAAGIQAQDLDAVNQAALQAATMEPNQLVFNRSGERAPTTVAPLDAQTRTELSSNPVVQGIDRGTRNFLRHLAPLNSGGDSVQLRVEGEAGAGWGWFGVRGSGSATFDVTRGDEGLYHVRIGIGGEVGATAGRVTRAGGAEVGIAGGGEANRVYRFRSIQEVDQFMRRQILENVPMADRIFSSMTPPRANEGRVDPNIQTVGYGRVHGTVKVGSVSVTGSFERRETTNRFPGGMRSEDWANIGRVQVNLGDNVRGDFTYNRNYVQNDPVAENTGNYKRIEGEVTLTITPAMQRALSRGETGQLMGMLMQTAVSLDLTGPAAERFMAGASQRITDALGRNGGQPVNPRGASVQVALSLQAQWEVQTDGPGRNARETGREDLQYVRLGTTARVNYGAGFDVGVAHGRLQGSASITNQTNLVTGREVTYLQGLWRNNRDEYNVYRAQVGPNTQIVDASTGTAMTLAQWEARWQQGRFAN